MAESEIITIAIEDLESFLAGTTASKLSLKITGITSGNLNMIKAALRQNPTVYVDLSSTEIPNSVTYMRYCFENCTSLVKAPNIPNSVTNMYSCFYGCTSLAEAPVIPNSVTDMSHCFRNCTSLVETPVIPNSVTDMGFCFYGCTSLIEAPNIPNSVTNMWYCFYNCTSLVKAPNIPNSVTDMSVCFFGCTSLIEAANIPNSVTAINACFQDCTSLIEAPNIPNSVTNMYSCFYNCTSLVKAPNIPNSVTDMSVCFFGCTSLIEAPNIPNSVTAINACFENCTSLVEAPVIPNSVTDMDSCFQGCTSLIEAPNIPNSVTNMRYCFYDCTSLHTIQDWQVRDMSKVDMSECFIGCLSLQNIFVTEPKVNKYSLFYADVNDTTANCTFVNTDGEQTFSVEPSKLIVNGMIDELAIGTSLTKEKALELYRYRVPFSNNAKDFSPDDPHMVLWAKNKNKVKSNVVDAGLTIDSALSSTSTNPVQNKVINAEISNIFSAKNSVEDFNTTIEPGVYYWTTNSQNRPNPYGVLLITRFYSGSNSVWINQTAYATNNNIYFRQRINDGDWTNWRNITYSNATTSADGLMSATDKTKLDDIETGANKTVVDSSLSSTSTNPVQNKAIYSALSNYSKLQLINLWGGISSTGAVTLTMSQNMTDFKFILVEACMYSNPLAQRVYSLIPASQLLVQSTTEDKDNFLFIGSLSDETRRLRFYFPTGISLYKLASQGASGHQPVITNVWGLK